MKKNYRTPLHIVIVNESVKMGELLISKGADINAIDFSDFNKISSFLIILKQIKERNLNKNNRTPLHYAANNGSNKIGELLISKGADINAKDIISQNIFYLFFIMNIQIK